MVHVLPPEGKIALVVANGDLDFAQLIVAYGTALRNAAPLTLWDLSEARLRQIDAVTIRTLARRVVELGKGIPLKKAQAAVVCARPVDYGITRMLMTYLEQEGYPVRIAAFMNRDAARTWLLGNAAE